MSHATRLAILAAALTLAASGAHAFTMNDPSTSSPYGSQGAKNYGSTLTDPGSQIRNFTPDLSTPDTSTTTKPEGFSFRFGSGGPFGADSNRRLAPPAWSTDPLYLERDH